MATSESMAIETPPQTCTYADSTWSAAERRAVDISEVEKPYAALSDDERDGLTGCSICREDQVEIVLPGVEPFQVCKAVADDVETALRRAMDAGFKIDTVTGYRAGRSKGVLDAQGRRTEYSNHAFGLAIDVNAETNGLYDRCTEFSRACRLIRGGEWRPSAPVGISPDTPFYEEMRAMGWQWGGELSGRQKDFMHFSPSGD
ncbi:M15 family metallopeptidase [Hyphococcus sp.]|uniref:M15 family metallopeptidase n=1 Tax=Hyphococcus sp. TaxID=2038636 RepID=UPI002081E1E5|nr:MAG: hypothetical protein DHS20C04_31260 [Marinicaulis sp.]